MNPERRIYPRVNMHLPAEIESHSGNRLDVTLLNLSVSGMLIEGEASLASLSPPVEGAPLELSLHFGLDEQAIHCHCRVVYQRRQSQNCIQLGLSLLSIDHAALECMQRYIQQSLK